MANFINTQFQVLTPIGFQNFDSIQIKNADRILKFKLEDETELKVTENHRFGLDNIACKLIVGNYLDTKNGQQKIIRIDIINGDFEVADLLNVNGSTYYTNQILSHNCSFEKSGNTVIDSDIIEWYEKNCVRDPIIKEAFDHNFWIWQHPDYGKTYIISADVARGDAANFSTVIVSCVETMEQVAEYKGKLPPSQFGELLVQIGKRYNEGMIICENNSIGFAAIQKILDTMYPKVYWSKKAEGQLFFDPLNWHLPGPDKIPGFQTGPKNRPLVISNWEEMLRTKTYIIRSSRLLDEIKGFIWVNNGNSVKAQAAEQMDDDLVMACAIGLFARNTTLKLSSQDVTQVNALLDSISVESGRHSISGFSIQQEAANRDANKNPYKFGDYDFTDVAMG